MSTKITKQHGESFHLFAECFDSDEPDFEKRRRLWLDLDGIDFRVKTLATGQVRVTVELRPEVLGALRYELAGVTDKLGLLEEAVAHFLWAESADLADVDGARHALKKLIPPGSLHRYNERAGK